VSPEADALLARVAPLLDALWPEMRYGTTLREHPYRWEVERLVAMAHGVRLYVRARRAKAAADATYYALEALLDVLNREAGTAAKGGAS